MSCYSDSAYVNDWDDHHDNVQSNYFVSGVVESVHANRQEDRRWKWRYCRPSDAPSAFLSTYTLSRTALDEYWWRNCYETTDLIGGLIGVNSDHNNWWEDREWSMYCGVLDTSQYYLGNCYDTGYLNDWDATFSFSCSNNGIIAALYSKHQDTQQDRQFGFWCCNIYNQPTASPTRNPTKKPTPNPSKPPTPSPSPNPTKKPTEHPSRTPTTPSPSTPGTLTCGDSHTGPYNNVAIEFKIRMPYQGDLTFDASQSNFAIDSLSGKPFGGQVIAADSDNDAILTLTDLTTVGDYIFTMDAAEGITGLYSVTVTCSSDAPTNAPSTAPSASPTGTPTLEPTVDPTNAPSGAPTRQPTEQPSVRPSKSPTTSPSKRPTRSPAAAIVIKMITNAPSVTVEMEVGDDDDDDDEGESGNVQGEENEELGEESAESGEIGVNAYIIIGLVALAVLSCVGMVCYCFVMKKKKGPGMKQGENSTIDVGLEGVEGGGTAGGTAGTKDGGNVLPTGETEMIAMVTDDGCNQAAEAEQLIDQGSDESDHELYDGLVKGDVGATDVARAVDMMVGDTEEKTEGGAEQTGHGDVYGAGDGTTVGDKVTDGDINADLDEDEDDTSSSDEDEELKFRQSMYQKSTSVKQGATKK